MSEDRRTVASTVRALVSLDPCLHDCVTARLVNFSELARRLKPVVERELGRRVDDASVKMALIRYAERAASVEHRRRIMSVLARSSVEARAGIAVVTVRVTVLPRLVKLAELLLGRARIFTVMQSLTTVTIIVDEEHLDDVIRIVGRENVVELLKDQAAVIIVSPRDVISTPGVIAYITGVLARNGINITQVESCHTDTILIVSKEDLYRAFRLVSSMIETARRELG